MSIAEDLQSALGSAYSVDRELRGGGMSRIFVATDRSLQRQVVVKVLPPILAADINVERFRREIATAARLQYAHIVPLLSAGEVTTPEGSVPYFTMPLVEGESLRARLAGGELPMSEAVAILRDVAKALAFAHSHNVVHRDIKPDNVMLSAGAASVTDFGVAKALGDASPGTVTSTGVSVGTPAYMAPEQASADPGLDYRADIYAFGVLAYEMLTGSVPFAGRSPQQMLKAHVTETPVDLATLRPAVPPAVGELVMRCLAKQPADRPQTADELVRTLEAGSTPLPPRPTFWLAFTRWMTTRPDALRRLRG